MYKARKNNKFCYSNISYYSWSADARATDELTSGIARCSCAPSLDSVLAPKIQKRNIFGKGVSNLRACLDYCKRSCMKLRKIVFQSKQKCSTDWKASVASLNVLERLLYLFVSSISFLRQMGGKIQIFTTSCWISTITYIFKVLLQGV